MKNHVLVLMAQLLSAVTLAILGWEKVSALVIVGLSGGRMYQCKPAANGTWKSIVHSPLANIINKKCQLSCGIHNGSLMVELASQAVSSFCATVMQPVLT